MGWPGLGALQSERTVLEREWRSLADSKTNSFLVLSHLTIPEAESCVLPLKTSQHHDRAFILVEQSRGIPASQNFTLRGFAFTKDLPSCPFTIGCALESTEVSVCAGEVTVRWPSRWTASFQDAVTGSARGRTPGLVDALPGPWQMGGGSFTRSRQSLPLPAELRFPATALPALGTCRVNGVQAGWRASTPDRSVLIETKERIKHASFFSRDKCWQECTRPVCSLLWPKASPASGKRVLLPETCTHDLSYHPCGNTLCLGDITRESLESSVSFFFSSLEGRRCEDNDTSVYSQQRQAMYEHVPMHQVK